MWNELINYEAASSGPEKSSSGHEKLFDSDELL